MENLWLDYEGERVYFVDEDLSPTSTLSSFKVLRNLRMGMYLWFGIEGDGTTWAGADDQDRAPNLATLMPASIETLYFSRTQQGQSAYDCIRKVTPGVRVVHAGAADDRF